MSEVRRIQLRRTKGWRLPADAVSVARPTRWGNPFRVGQAYVLRQRRNIPYPELRIRGGSPVTDRAHAVELFRAHIAFEDAGIWGPAHIRTELGGWDLACWCPLDEPCHADVLLRMANAKDDAG